MQLSLKNAISESIYYHTCFVDDCLVEFQVLDTASGQVSTNYIYN